MARHLAVTTASLMFCCGIAAAGSVYNDATGDEFFGGTNHLDLVSVTISNDATNLYIDILTGGDLDATNWGKYGVGIDTGAFAGTNSNGWGRNVDWGRDVTHWVGTWADDGGSGVGGQVWSYGTGSWNQTGSVSGDDSQHAAGRQRFSIALALLGLSVGDSFEFDVISTGGTGGDPGVDHLSRGDFATPGWGTTSVAGEFLSYTVTPAVVPLPPAAWAGLATLAGALGVRRLRRR
jgi:hypothetical protein